MQNDLIRRSELLESLNRLGIKEPNLRYTEGFNSGIAAAKFKLKTAPAIDAVPVMHGRWVQESFDDQDEGIYVCSHCRQENFFAFDEERYRYCPNCGAKMDGGAD